MDFTEFKLSPKLLSGLEKANYKTCTPVQKKVLQQGLNGVDLYVQSQTGTGKTAAYLVLIFQQLINNSNLSNKKALVLVPTRELAVQVEEEAKLLASSLTYKIASFYGGVGYEKQYANINKGVNLIIGTPGRIIDLCDSKAMNLNDVSFLVVDEADRMFDMGFYPDLRKLIKMLPSYDKRQTMLFSATLNTWVKNLAWEYTKNAIEIEIEPENITVDEIEQVLFHVSNEEKLQLMLGIIKKENPDSLIVFCNTKKMSEIVSKRLNINNIKSKYIIGDLPQSKRLNLINSFKDGSLRCLVATDVAARGLDVEELSMVINYDLPNEAENYIHRIGRTARAGKTGKAYSLCSENDVYNLPAIEKYIESKIPSIVAMEEDLGKDKSKNIYIKLDSEENNYNQNIIKTNNKQTKHTRYNRQQSKNFKPSQKTHKEIDLSVLSFEQRMEYYKTKYNPSNEQSVNRKEKENKVSTKGLIKKEKNKNHKQNNKKKDLIKKQKNKWSLLSRIKAYYRFLKQDLV